MSGSPPSASGRHATAASAPVVSHSSEHTYSSSAGIGRVTRRISPTLCRRVISSKLWASAPESESHWSAASAWANRARTASATAARSRRPRGCSPWARSSRIAAATTVGRPCWRIGHAAARPPGTGSTRSALASMAAPTTRANGSPSAGSGPSARRVWGRQDGGAKGVADVGEQFARAERLGHDPADGQPGQFLGIEFEALGGQQQGGDGFGQFRRQTGTHLQAAHERHLEIGHHEVRVLGHGPVEGLLPVHGDDDVKARVLEFLGDDGRDAGLIVRHQNLPGHQEPPVRQCQRTAGR